jgi:hypothetical protein
MDNPDKKQFVNRETQLADEMMEKFHGEEIGPCVLACTLVSGFLLSKLDVPIEEMDKIIDQNARHMKTLLRKAQAIRRTRMM